MLNHHAKNYMYLQIYHFKRFLCISTHQDLNYIDMFNQHNRYLIPQPSDDYIKCKVQNCHFQK